MRHSFPAALFLLLPFALGAQGAGDRAQLLLNTTRALWMDSANAAGLTVSAPEAFNLVDAGYSYEAGDYRRMQTGTSVGVFDFDTQGALKVGKVQLWGRFRYDNTNDRGSSFNTLLYDPYDERFMYTAADTVAGQWKKQSYEMQFKASVPLGERFAAGVHVNYTDRIAAGQIDPRAESYHYSVTVRPGLVWNAGSSTIGLNGQYSNTFERTTPSISNTQEIQKVYLLRGLGNWVGEQVGGGGLGTMYFRCNTWGGGLQYAYNGSWRMLAEAGYALHNTEIHETATQPKPHGDTRRQEFNANATALFGTGVLHKIGLSSDVAITTGIEPTTQWNKETGEWEITYSAEQCNLVSWNGILSYDAFVLDGDSYTWHFSAEAGVQAKQDSYAVPASRFEYANAVMGAGAERSWLFNNGSSLLLGGGLSFVKYMYRYYEYNGHRAGAAPVRDLYPHDLSILSADRLTARMAAEYAFPVGKGLKLAFCAEGSSLVASCIDNSDLASITIKSRTALLSAVRLYF